ncbi:MAG: DUF1194 domain-containing protein [Hyphomicrobiaceae bacterium]|nr:DUF1194 domain-containing protein [Hyphomicrobiaceae bacterium]
MAFVLIAPHLALAYPVKAASLVDLELVLAVDISMSMDLEEQRLQRDGYVAALRDPQVIKAIQSGPQGRIAVTYVEWAGQGTHTIVVPWRQIATAREANAFANELERKPIARARRTSISSALLFSATLFGERGRRSLRRVIDVSGDGPNNSGIVVLKAREQVLKKGIIINGLPIQIRQTGYSAFSYFDIADLERYYRDCVIGGPGSFALSIKTRAEFATATRQKLLLEIAGRVPEPAPLVQKAQFRPLGSPSTTKRTDCEVGEKRWEQFWQDIE